MKFWIDGWLLCRLVGPPPVFETVRKVHPSPMLSSKSSAHLQRSHQLSKTLFQDGAEFKVGSFFL